MLVQNWMSKQVITLEPEDTLEHAVKLIYKHKIKMLPVIDHGKVVGILSEIDLKRAHSILSEVLVLDDLTSKVKIKQIMTRDPITVPPEYTIEEAAELIISKDISGLPVVDAAGELAGIITRHDLFKILVSLSGPGRKGVQFAFRVEDRPGSIKGLTNLLRNFGGRIHSILSTYEGVPAGFRKVYIRAYNIDRGKLPQLFKELQAKATMLYFVDRRENLREIFQ